MRLAAVRLGWTAEQCLEATPAEIATQFFGERKRRNQRLAEKAWEIAWLMSPHVARENKETATPRNILMSAPGFQPDEAEMING